MFLSGIIEATIVPQQVIVQGESPQPASLPARWLWPRLRASSCQVLGRSEAGIQLLLPDESIKSKGGPTYTVRFRLFTIVETYVECLFAAANPHGDLLPETTILPSAVSPGEVTWDKFPLTPEDRR